jgi:hypothetical protein
MRKVMVLEHMSLDGVIQGPGSPQEDTTGGFELGGWISGYSDPVLGSLLREKMSSEFDLMRGRKTFEIWSSHWP